MTSPIPSREEVKRLLAEAIKYAGESSTGVKVLRALLHYMDEREWRTIDSAPKTGERVLLWDGFHVFEGFWNGMPEQGCFCTYESCSVRPHTKMWMPLPSPPALSLSREG